MARGPENNLRKSIDALSSEQLAELNAAKAFLRSNGKHGDFLSKFNTPAGPRRLDSDWEFMSHGVDTGVVSSECVVHALAHKNKPEVVVVCASGERDGQQDGVLLMRKGDVDFYLIADGMGGPADGEKASARCVEETRDRIDRLSFQELGSIPKVLVKDLAEGVIGKVSRQIRDRQGMNIESGSTYLLMVLNTKMGEYAVAQLGDGVGFTVAPGKTANVIASPQSSMDSQGIGYDSSMAMNCRNRLKYCVGLDYSPEQIAYCSGNANAGVIFHLCSDGESDNVLPVEAWRNPDSQQSCYPSTSAEAILLNGGSRALLDRVKDLTTLALACQVADDSSTAPAELKHGSNKPDNLTSITVRLPERSKREAPVVAEIRTAVRYSVGRRIRPVERVPAESLPVGCLVAPAVASVIVGFGVIMSALSVVAESTVNKNTPRDLYSEVCASAPPAVWNHISGDDLQASKEGVGVDVTVQINGLNGNSWNAVEMNHVPWTCLDGKAPKAVLAYNPVESDVVCLSTQNSEEYGCYHVVHQLGILNLKRELEGVLKP
jgi:serine/threonine protein phosphatase PrpC